uniref:Uncharacterized protein n=1 Tax=Meloidogyne incognita TaxID=6306 RepID=A0A914NC13_MELIC
MQIVYLIKRMQQESSLQQGYVTTGPFAPWETLEGNPYITRQVGQDGRFLKDD